MNAADTIGQYRFIERLGAGAFGEVWKAEHVELGVVRAVKIPRSRDIAARLKEEGRIVAKLEALRHSNIIQIYDLNTSGGIPYVVYEYVEGEDLATRLCLGPMSVEEVIDLAVQLLSGLAAAHEQGIIHRDIKPSNILIARDDTVKIADFGLGQIAESQALALSRASISGGPFARLSPSQVLAPQSEIGDVVGTLAYMAPEQRRGDEVTAAADMYSLGVVLYEALTRELPEGAFERPSELVTSVSPQLDGAVMDLLSRRPERRPSARGLLDALSVPRIADKGATPSATMSDPAATGPPRSATNTSRIPFQSLPRQASSAAAAGARSVGRERASADDRSARLTGRLEAGLVLALIAFWSATISTIVLWGMQDSRAGASLMVSLLVTVLAAGIAIFRAMGKGGSASNQAPHWRHPSRRQRSTRDDGPVGLRDPNRAPTASVDPHRPVRCALTEYSTPDMAYLSVRPTREVPALSSEPSEKPTVAEASTRSVYELCAQDDFKHAIELALGIADEALKNELLSHIVRCASEADEFNRALTAAESIADERIRDASLLVVVTAASQETEFKYALNAVAAIRSAKQKDAAAQHVAAAATDEDDFSYAVSAATLIEDPGVRRHVAGQVMTRAAEEGATSHALNAQKLLR